MSDLATIIASDQWEDYQIEEWLREQNIEVEEFLALLQEMTLRAMRDHNKGEQLPIVFGTYIGIAFHVGFELAKLMGARSE